MIEINLLPEELRKKKRQTTSIDVSKIDLKSFPIVSIAGIAVGGIVIIQLVLFIVGFANGTNYKTLEKDYKTALPQIQETQRLRSQVASMGAKVAAIDELMVKRFSWVRELNALSDSMMPGIWLTELGYYEKTGEITVQAKIKPSKAKSAGEPSAPVTEKVTLRFLTMSGMASSATEEGTALIGHFIKSLKSNSEFYSDFNDIELGTITRDKVDEQEVMKFNITCPFKMK